MGAPLPAWPGALLWAALNPMRAEFGADRVRCYGVYRGARPARWNDIQVLPVMDFLRRLWDGDILD